MSSPTLSQRPTARQEIPSSYFIRTLALRAVEAVRGLRPLEQLSRHVSGEVFDRLLMQRTLHRERAQVYQDTRRIVPMPGKVLSSVLSPYKVCASVVMHTPGRSYAVVVRLELQDTRWRAVELAIL